MTFLEHVEALRGTLLGILSALLFGSLLAAAFYPHLFDAIMWPLDSALGEREEDLRNQVLRTSGPFQIFTVMIQVVLMGGIAFAIPFAIYFVARFIAPGLTPREKRVLIPGCAVAGLLFMAGAAITYFLILPATMRVSLFFNEKANMLPMWDGARYFGTVLWMTFGVGLIFQFPLILFILQYVEVLTPAKLVKGRRYAVALILVASALILPGGDPISLALLFVPLYLLYEGAIVAGRWGLRKKVEAEREDAARAEALGEEDDF